MSEEGYKQEFEIGATVMLKSGGPRMTVREWDSSDDTYICVWFVEEPEPGRWSGPHGLDDYFKGGTLVRK